MSSSIKAFISDLDGTLTDSKGKLLEENARAFNELQDQGILTVIATGRHFYSLENYLPADFPVDYIIYCSGAAAIHWKTREHVFFHNLNDRQAKAALDLVWESEIDFMAHSPLPQNHTYGYRRKSSLCEDYNRRLKKYADWGTEWQTVQYPETLSEVLGIVDSKVGPKIYNHFKQAVPQLSVIRATSPLDKQSVWLEIFAPQVSKGQASHELMKMYGISASETAAIGNDYNDEDLLAWAGKSFLVSNSPEEMQKIFTTVKSSNDLGVIQALGELGLTRHR